MRKELFNDLLAYHSDRVAKEIKDGLESAENAENTTTTSPAEIEGLKEKIQGLESSKDDMFKDMAEKKAKEEAEERERVKKGFPRRSKNQKN